MLSTTDRFSFSLTAWPVRTENEAVRLQQTSSLATSAHFRIPGSNPMERSRLVKAIGSLFMEYFHRYSFLLMQDQPQIFHSQPHLCRSCFFPAFPGMQIPRVLKPFRSSYPPSVVPRAWESGCARIPLTFSALFPATS